MTNEPEDRTNPRDWPRKWIREEKFWFDITTRTISALVAALAVFLFALGAGYVKTPSGLEVIRSVGWTVIGTSVVVLFIWAFHYNPQNHVHRRTWVRRTLSAIAWIIVISAAVIFLDSLNPIDLWPLNTTPFTYELK